VVPGATVTAENKATGLKRQATTNDEGQFTIPLLPPSTYTVTAQAGGFSPVQISNVVLNVGDQKALQIQLKAGDVNAVVTVEAEASIVRTDASVSTVIDRQFVANLPLSGRSFQSLIELTPGVALYKVNPNGSLGGQFSVNGQRANTNYFTVDGVSANTGITTGSGTFVGQSGAGELPALTAVGSTQSLVSVDALQEFRIQTSTYAPEFGRTPGGQISMVTRSGANSFHGTLFEYFRNQAMDATDWFANANRLPKPPERQHDFGGTFSGPIMLPRFGEGGRQPWYNGRNRTFFFFSSEGLRLRLPQAKVVGVPTVALRQQVPAAVRTLLNAYPLPNGRDLGNGVAEFAASYADPSQFDATALRIDHTIGSRVTIFGRYSRTPSFSASRSLSLNTITETRFENDSWTSGMTWILSSSVTNDLRANWTRTRAVFHALADTFGGAVLPPADILFPSGRTAENARLNLQMNGTSAFQIGTGKDNFQRQFNIVDGLTLLKGAHSLKLGVDYRRISPTLFASDFSTYNFGAVSNAIAGRLSSVIISRFAGGASVALFTNLSAYAQDSWNVTRRLRLTYGLRWELNPPPSSPNNHLPVTIADIRAPEPVSLAPRNTPLWTTTYNNFAPRIGVAYKLSQANGRELVIRGGFGVFYDTGFGPSATTFQIYPFVAQKVLRNVAYPLSAADAQPPVPGIGDPSQLFIMDRRLKLPYTYQWNLSMEQSLGSKQMLTASYVGAAGRRLLREEDFDDGLLFKEFTEPIFVGFFTNTGKSDYKALQIQFQRRLSRGLQALVNYTLSKSNDTASDDLSTQSTPAPSTVIDPSRDYGPSDFDVRYVFTGGVTYDLPKPAGPRFVGAVLGHWGIDGLVRARTAFPLNVRTSVTLPTGTYSVHPNIVPGVPQVLTGSQFPGGKRLNGAAFSTPAAGTVGNFPRNSLRGFPASQVDMTLRRQFGLSEKVKLQFRFDVFNVFNHPNFADPPLNLAGILGPFGVSAQMLNRGLGGLNALYHMGGPRSGQIAVKLVF